MSIKRWNSYTLDSENLELVEHNVINFDKDIRPMFNEMDWKCRFKEGSKSKNEEVKKRCKSLLKARVEVYEPTDEEKLRLLALIATWASCDNDEYCGTYPITDHNAIYGGLEWWCDELFGTGKKYGVQ